MKTIKCDKGFSLVEVLIAITLLAVGLLALAGMQTTAITGNTFSQSGTVALQLAQEMVDRIRTNAGVNPGLYNGIDTTGGCPAVDPAQSDCVDWQGRLANASLLNAAGTVSVSTDSPIGNAATITVNVIWGPPGNTRRVSIATFLETWGT